MSAVNFTYQNRETKVFSIAGKPEWEFVSVYAFCGASTTDLTYKRS